MKRYATFTACSVTSAILSILVILVILISCPLLMYVTPTIWVMLFGPPDHLLHPDSYAKYLISNWEDIPESEVEIVQIHELDRPEQMYAVIVRYFAEGENRTRLLTFQERGGTLHLLATVFMTTRSDEHISATASRYFSESGSPFYSVDGLIISDEVSEVFVDFFVAGETKRTAAIEDRTFLLFDAWPAETSPTATIIVSALNADGDSISTIVLPFEQ